MASVPLRVGIVGFGFAGRTFHAPVIAAVPGLMLAAVASSQPEAVVAAWPGVEVVPDIDALLERCQVDLVVIAAPNAQHHSLARRALLAGRHVVVDKPFTLDVDEARDLARLATASGRLLSVYQNRRFDGDFLTLQSLLASGELERPVYFESHFDRFRPQVRDRWREQPVPGAGLWVDLGSHLLDQALQLFGPPDTIQLDIAAMREGALVEDYFHAILRYEAPGQHRPLRVVLHATTLAAAPAPRFLLHGTQASYVKEGVEPQEDALRAGGRPGTEGWGHDSNPGEIIVQDADGSSRSRSIPGLSGNYADYYAAVRDAIDGKGANPVSPESAVELMQWLDAGKQSAREGRALSVASLPKP